jgi:hypothetical protein
VAIDEKYAACWLLRQAQDIAPKKQGCDVLFFALKGQVIVAQGAALGKGQQ